MDMQAGRGASGSSAAFSTQAAPADGGLAPSSPAHAPASEQHANSNVAAPVAAATPAAASAHAPYPRRRASASSSSSSEPWGQSTTAVQLASASSSTKFALTKNFLDKWRNKPPPFGYNGLGELVYRRTYSRKRIETGDAAAVAAGMQGANETWAETVERVVNGCYNMQKRWIESHELGWNAWKAQKSAQEMYERMFEMKFLPPGRGLWAMGSPITESRNIFAALNNCAFVSTEGMEKEDDKSKPFTFLMDASMLGVGVGFDTKGAGKLMVKGVNAAHAPRTFVIPDSREGWVEALRLLINAHVCGREGVLFDYSLIRPFGTPIKGFGGVASGPAALKEMLDCVRTLLENRAGAPLTLTDITDIMNLIGRCVVAGNVRRCLPGGALVHTKGGLVPIRDVKKGEEVLTSRGFRPVVEHVVQGPQALVKIVTQDGEFRCTPTHRMAVLTDRKGNYAWKRADELKSGDRLMSPRTPLPGTHTTLPAWHADAAAPADALTVPPLDAAMAWFVGLFHAVGDAQPNHAQGGLNASVSLKLRAEQREVASKAVQQLQRFGAGLLVEMNDVEGHLTVRCQSAQLACYFEQHIKRPLPSWILTGTLASRQAYVAGALDADSGANDKSCVMSTASSDWALQLQRLLYSCGVESRVELDRSLARSKLLLITQYASRAVAAFPELCKVLPMPSLLSSSNGFPLAWCSDLPALRGSADASQSAAGEQVGIDSYNATEGATAFCPVSVLHVSPDGSEDTFDLSVSSDHEFFVDGILAHNTAEIAFGSADSLEYLDLKNYAKNPERAGFGWTSNNSVFATLGMDYKQVVERVRANGEPGFAWLDNMQQYSRMNGSPDGRDHRVRGGNPCLEQSLESYELCCLVENFPNRHVDEADFQRTLKFAYLYAKTVTLGKTHWPETNRVMLRNRRIGCSVSGVAQFVSQRGLHELQGWLERGYEKIQEYDKNYSDWFAIPRSIKTTSVKPSGTVSLLAGATPGIHFPESRFYIRRMRLSAASELVGPLREAGYPLEPAVDGGAASNTVVVEIPVDVGEGVRTVSEVPMWEQLSLAAFMQRHWADNQARQQAATQRARAAACHWAEQPVQVTGLCEMLRCVIC